MKNHDALTGLFSMCWRLLRPFLIWLFKALESRGLRSSKLQSNSADTDITAPSCRIRHNTAGRQKNTPRDMKVGSTHIRGTENCDQYTIIENS